MTWSCPGRCWVPSLHLYGVLTTADPGIQALALTRAAESFHSLSCIHHDYLSAQSQILQLDFSLRRPRRACEPARVCAVLLESLGFFFVLFVLTVYTFGIVFLVSGRHHVLDRESQPRDGQLRGPSGFLYRTA